MLTFEDKFEITELAARYNYALDTGDGDAWAATFTDDGVFASSGSTLTGTEAPAEFARDRDSAGLRHWTNNLVVDGEGREATLRCYLHVVRRRTRHRDRPNGPLRGPASTRRWRVEVLSP
jgi:ketosteroid isomerase-like protein